MTLTNQSWAGYIAIVSLLNQNQPPVYIPVCLHFQSCCLLCFSSLHKTPAIIKTQDSFLATWIGTVKPILWSGQLWQQRESLLILDLQELIQNLENALFIPWKSMAGLFYQFLTTMDWYGDI